jgi:hypothetical protein
VLLLNSLRLLDDTYGRILDKAPKNYRNVVHVARQLLAVSFRPLTVEEVAMASAVDFKNEKFDHVLQQPCNPYCTSKSVQVW